MLGNKQPNANVGLTEIAVPGPEFSLNAQRGETVHTTLIASSAADNPRLGMMVLGRMCIHLLVIGDPLCS